jgi:hypothetical protein
VDVRGVVVRDDGPRREIIVITARANLFQGRVVTLGKKIARPSVRSWTFGRPGQAP